MTLQALLLTLFLCFGTWPLKQSLYPMQGLSYAPV